MTSVEQREAVRYVIAFVLWIVLTLARRSRHCAECTAVMAAVAVTGGGD